MNIARLKEAEQKFFQKYPGGFSNQERVNIKKKHKPEKMHDLAFNRFKPDNFDDPDMIVESMNKIVSQSSMVSLFEKLKFRDMIKILSGAEKIQLTLGIKEFIHGDKEAGFEILTDSLDGYKLAKWTLVTVCPYYYAPNDEVFIKPTTAKMIIERFEFDGLRYDPKPTYAFYKAYKEQLGILKKEVDNSLKQDNAAFCGFLMFAGSDD